MKFWARLKLSQSIQRHFTSAAALIKNGLTLICQMQAEESEQEQRQAVIYPAHFHVPRSVFERLFIRLQLQLTVVGTSTYSVLIAADEMPSLWALANWTFKTWLFKQDRESLSRPLSPH